MGKRNNYFDDQQIEKMQKAIKKSLDIYEERHGKNSNSKEAICKEIQKIIDGLTEKERELLPRKFRDVEYFNVDGEDLRKFGRGYLKKGKRIFNKFDSDEKRAMVAIFLTNPTIRKKYHAKLTIQELGLGDNDLQLPLLLSQALNSNNINIGIFSPDTLCGKAFTGEVIRKKGARELELVITMQLDDLIYSACLTEQNKSSKYTLKYIGWIIVSENQNLVFIGRHSQENSINYFISSAIDTSKIGDPVNALIFYHHEKPLNMMIDNATKFNMQKFSNYQEILKYNLSNNLLKLYRD